ncbi:MAG: IS21 family transposase [bacterium]|nr:IS21 family transposase [bacterium]
MKDLYEMRGEGRSIRGIARELGISRNSVRKYLRSSGVPRAKPRPRRASKLDGYTDYIDGRLSEGMDNCAVLLRELRARGYAGGYTILKDYVQPRRRPRQPRATVRFETEPGEQAQVDWGSLSYVTREGRKRRMWAFVMVLSWSRAIYVEFVRRADAATFMRCHVNAFEYFGGVPRRCLYDNAKVVVLGRDDAGRPEWNSRMLDLSLRVGFEMRLCRPYRAQTKGKVESGVKYVRRNLWPTIRFSDDADMNRQGIEWCDAVANERVHGTTMRKPKALLGKERAQMLPMPDRSVLAPYLREERKVGRDGYVNWDGAWYGVPWTWSARTVQVGVGPGTVEIWSGQERVAVHPRAHRRGERLTLPGQWDGLVSGGERPRREAVAMQISSGEVERRPLDVYEMLACGGAR